MAAAEARPVRLYMHEVRDDMKLMLSLSLSDISLKYHFCNIREVWKDLELISRLSKRIGNESKNASDSL